MLHKANAAVDRELRSEALVDLCSRVDDWKNHRVDQFGELLLHGQFPVVTGKAEMQKEVRPQVWPQSDIVRQARSSSVSSLSMILGPSNPMRKALPSKWLHSASRSCPVNKLDFECEVTPPIKKENSSSDTRQIDASNLDFFLDDMVFDHISYHPSSSKSFLAEQYANMMGLRPTNDQYTIYLFERILLCCKDLNPNKSKDKLLGTQKDKKDKKDKKGKDGKNTKLQLKGRIFMTNVTEVLSLSKQGSQNPSFYAYHFSNHHLRILFGSDILERGSRS